MSNDIDRGIVDATVDAIEKFVDMRGTCNEYWQFKLAMMLAKRDPYRLDDFIRFLQEAQSVSLGQKLGCIKTIRQP